MEEPKKYTDLLHNLDYKVKQYKKLKQEIMDLQDELFQIDKAVEQIRLPVGNYGSKLK